MSDHWFMPSAEECAHAREIREALLEIATLKARIADLEKQLEISLRASSAWPKLNGKNLYWYKPGRDESVNLYWTHEAMHERDKEIIRLKAELEARIPDPEEK